MLGALLTGGASLISGLFGRSSAKKQAKREEQAIAANNKAMAEAARIAEIKNEALRSFVTKRADAAASLPIRTQVETEDTSSSVGSVDMAGFMAAAEQNGFNPLTFLRSGALSLFAKTTNTNKNKTLSNVWNSQNMEAALAPASLGGFGGGGGYASQPVIASTRVPGIGEVFGNALTTGVNQYMADASAERQRQHEYDMVTAQLGGAQRPGSLTGGRSFFVPSVKTSGGKTVNGMNAGISKFIGAGLTFKNPGDPLCLMGKCISTDPKTSNAEDAETRYADIGSNIYALGVIGADIVKTGRDWGIPDYPWSIAPAAAKASRDLTAKKVGDYVKSISASPSNPGKSWGELANDWGLSW